jgi:hypothetical protein
MHAVASDSNDTQPGDIPWSDGWHRRWGGVAAGSRCPVKQEWMASLRPPESRSVPLRAYIPRPLPYAEVCSGALTTTSLRNQRGHGDRCANRSLSRYVHTPSPLTRRIPGSCWSNVTAGRESWNRCCCGRSCYSIGRYASWSLSRYVHVPPPSQGVSREAVGAASLREELEWHSCGGTCLTDCPSVCT